MWLSWAVAGYQWVANKLVRTTRITGWSNWHNEDLLPFCRVSPFEVCFHLPFGHETITA